jgi:hypothetical protein
VIECARDLPFVIDQIVTCRQQNKLESATSLSFGEVPPESGAYSEFSGKVMIENAV